MIYNSHFNHNLRKIQPVDPDRQGDSGESRKRRVLHQGRAWEEAEENDLPLQPTIPVTSTRSRRAQAGVYADKALLERAQIYFSQLTTIEEKAAQLCFLVTDAVYDAALQHEVELLIQTWQIGGILFHKGEYRRQAYLIERFREVSKTPLLFANDYLHGLSFYLQGTLFPKTMVSEQHYMDMGKAVMVQSRRLGIQIQFDRERSSESSMNEWQAKAFRKGVRGAQGIVGKEKAKPQLEQMTHSVKGPLPQLSGNEGPLLASFFAEHQVQETIGFKTLTFFDATDLDKRVLDEALCKAFKQLYDLFLFAGNISEGIRAIARLVRSSKILEEVLDRHVMKALIIKSLFFK